MTRFTAGVAASAAHFGQYALDLLHLLSIGLRQLAALDEKAVLEADAHISAKQGGLRQKRHLMAARRQYRPLEIRRSKQPVGGLLHEHEIVEFGANAAEDSEDQLHEEWRFDQPRCPESAPGLYRWPTS